MHRRTSQRNSNKVKDVLVINIISNRKRVYRVHDEANDFDTHVFHSVATCVGKIRRIFKNRQINIFFTPTWSNMQQVSIRLLSIFQEIFILDNKLTENLRFFCQNSEITVDLTILPSIFGKSDEKHEISQQILAKNREIKDFANRNRKALTSSPDAKAFLRVDQPTNRLTQLRPRYNIRFIILRSGPSIRPSHQLTATC